MRVQHINLSCVVFFLMNKTCFIASKKVLLLVLMSLCLRNKMFEFQALSVLQYSCQIWTLGEILKKWWKLPIKVVCSFEQILEVAPHKTAAVQPLNSHLTNQQNKSKKTCNAPVEKWGSSYKWCFPMDSSK